MTHAPIKDLREFWRDLFQRFQPVVEAWKEAIEKFGEGLDEIEEALTTYQEREKKRAYEHMITPPLDHTLAQVTHTRSKPPQPHRTYRRRTP